MAGIVLTKAELDEVRRQLEVTENQLPAENITTSAELTDAEVYALSKIPNGEEGLNEMQITAYRHAIIYRCAAMLAPLVVSALPVAERRKKILIEKADANFQALIDMRESSDPGLHVFSLKE